MKVKVVSRSGPIQMVCDMIALQIESYMVLRCHGKLSKAEQARIFKRIVSDANLLGMQIIQTGHAEFVIEDTKLKEEKSKC